MKIRKIILSKYKRFQSLTIDLGDNPKRIVALVGPNGCGKSSVFDGMLFLNRFIQVSPSLLICLSYTGFVVQNCSNGCSERQNERL